MVGVGREAFAYPDLPATCCSGRDGSAQGVRGVQPLHQIMRDHGCSGACFDKTIYGPIMNKDGQPLTSRALRPSFQCHVQNAQPGDTPILILSPNHA
jgi:hypothetical protein